MNSAYDEAINLVPYTNARGIPIKTKNGDMQFIQQANKQEKIKPYPEIIDLELYNGPNKQKFIKNKKFPMATKGSITIEKKDNSGRITRKMPVVKKARAVKKAPAVKKAQAPVQAAAVKKAPAKAPAVPAAAVKKAPVPAQAAPAQTAAAYNLASPGINEPVYNLASTATGPDYDLASAEEEGIYDKPSFVPKPESPYDNLVPGQKLEVKEPPIVGGRRKTKRNKKKTKRNKKKTKRNKKKTKRNKKKTKRNKKKSKRNYK